MKIKVKPTDIEIEGDSNRSVMQICWDNKIDIKSFCKGVPSCAECRIKVVSGEHNCLPPTHKELQVLGNNYFLDGRRLSCQLRAFGEITIDISEQLERVDSQTKKVRGFRMPAAKGGVQRDSHAVQGIMVLESDKSHGQGKKVEK